MRTQRQQRAERVLDYLYQNLEGTHAVVTGLEKPDFIYKGFIFTPKGTLKFGGSSVHFVRKDDAKRVIESWKRNPFPAAELSVLDLVKNWKKFDPHEGRDFEKEMISRHLGGRKA